MQPYALLGKAYPMSHARCRTHANFSYDKIAEGCMTPPVGKFQTVLDVRHRSSCQRGHPVARQHILLADTNASHGPGRFVRRKWTVNVPFPCGSDCVPSCRVMMLWRH